MATKNKITQYRGRLDKTLSCHDLTNKNEIRKLVKNKLTHSSQHGGKGYADSTLDKRTEEVSNFLDMLRSASTIDESKTHQASHAQWKLKQDTEEFRVMYREGPPGTPFHMLLVEGYVDGPVDSCLCVSWETALYKKWWPQYNVPSFKITYSQCLHQVRIDEQVSVVRVKVSWPLSTREALLHYFEFEYFQDDLIVVLINTISDVDPIDEDAYGLTSDQIPDSKGIVRVDLVGGFAIQKVSPERSYFRTIASIDMKLDFVPPSLINFISRQLIGSGFKLYQKAVASVAKQDGDFNNALEDPMYSRIRDALYSKDKGNTVPEPENPSHDTLIIEEDNFTSAAQDSKKVREEILITVNSTEVLAEKSEITDLKAVCEIEEEVLDETIKDEEIEEKIIKGKEIEETIIEEEEIDENMIEEEEIEGNMIEEEANKDDVVLDKERERVFHPPDKQNGEYHGMNTRKEVRIRPEVEQALETLQKTISLFRELGINPQNQTSAFVTKEPQNFREGIGEDSSEDVESSSGGLFSLEDPKETNAVNLIAERAPDELMNSFSIRNPTNTRSNSHPREMNHNKVAPVSLEPKLEVLAPPHRKLVEGQLPEDIVNTSEKIIIDEDDIHESSLEQRKKSSRQKNNRFCFCLHFVPGKW